MFWLMFCILSGQNKNVCNQNLTSFLKICNNLGVPIKEEKTVYAQTTMTFLGIEVLSWLPLLWKPDFLSITF